MSKRKKEAEKLLRAIEFESVPLSTNNRGRVIRNDHCPNKLNSKTKRHRGWITARWSKPGKYKEAMAEGTDSTYYYDPWEDGHDGIHFDPDRTHIRSEFMSGQQRCKHCSPTCHLYNTCEEKDNINPIQKNNERLIRLLKIRRAKKEKARIKKLL
jgi:hypothetical protein